MIKVVNKKTHKSTFNDYYIGRPSIFGNPFTHLKQNTKAEFQVETREIAIEKYKDWFDFKYKTDSKFKIEFDELVKIAKVEDVNLVCWCKPLSCHGDIIKQKIKEYLEYAKK